MIDEKFCSCTHLFQLLMVQMSITYITKQAQGEVVTCMPYEMCKLAMLTLIVFFAYYWFCLLVLQIQNR